jgi:GNAT superfamily N-acetyltransferase
MADDVVIRSASRGDVGVILELINGLADYEHLSEFVTATEGDLGKWLFDDPKAEIIVCEVSGEIAGFASFFHNISTFAGRPGIYIEDIFIRPDSRGKGLGKKLMGFLAKLAIERECVKLDWVCLDWNTPSREFYESLGSKEVKNWVPYRLSGQALKDLANGSGKDH